MQAGIHIEPDSDFLARLLANGGTDLKRCFQCGTCSGGCPLSPEGDPFPRRQMLHAQWGLKERLVADPAVWLCHNCGDCTDRCPRGARPGDVLGAIRAESIRHFAVPRGLAALAMSPWGLPWILLLPVLLFAAVAAWSGNGAGTSSLEFAALFPQATLEAIFFTVAALSVAGFAAGILRFAGALAPADRQRIRHNLPAALWVIGRHQRFCVTRPVRRWGHLLTFSGFVGLALVGTVVGIGTLLGAMHTPLAMTNGWKVVANVCAALLLAGLLLLVFDRLRDPVKRARTPYGDWAFIGTLVGIVVTGLASEGLRLMQAAPAMHAVYFVHLVLVFVLFLYAPYSKFAHVAYRTVAIAAAGVGPLEVAVLDRALFEHRLQVEEASPRTDATPVPSRGAPVAPLARPTPGPAQVR